MNTLPNVILRTRCGCERVLLNVPTQLDTINIALSTDLVIERCIHPTPPEAWEALPKHRTFRFNHWSPNNERVFLEELNS